MLLQRTSVSAAALARLSSVAHNTADEKLPDGNTYFDVNNCFGYDVFQYVEGKFHFFIELKILLVYICTPLYC